VGGDLAIAAQLGGLLAQNNASLFQCSTTSPTYPYCNVDAFAALQKQVGIRHSFASTAPDDQTTIKGVSNTTKVELADKLALKNIFGYRTNESLLSADIDGTPMPILDTHGETRLKQYTEEFQLSGTALADKMDYIVGAFYLKSEPDGLGGSQGLNVNAFGGLNNTTSANYLTETSYALYGQFDYDLSAWQDGVKFTAGYRQTWDKNEGCAFFVQYSPIPQFPPIAANTLGPIPSESECKDQDYTPDPSASSFSFYNASPVKSDVGTYTLALSWKVDQDILLYGTTRKGYRAGGFNVPQLPDVLSSLQTFDGETLEDVELGGKFKFMVQTMPGNFDVAVYTGKDKGFQYFEGTTGITIPADTYGPGSAAIDLPSGGIVYNKADLTIQGIELDTSIEPLNGLLLGLGYAYTDISVDSVSIPDALEVGYAAAGKEISAVQVPLQPKSQLNANIYYSLPTQIWDGNLSFNVDYHKQDKYSVAHIETPGYDTVDLRITLANAFGAPLDLSLYGLNVLDKEYAYGTGSSTGSQVGVTSYIFAPPATWGASMKYYFGKK
jgi:iron complex outermembrane recepter protein